MIKYAKLVGREIVPCDMFCRMADEDRRVGLSKIGEQTISTVFLRTNHGGYFGLPDQWFETMIFGGPYDQYQYRYTTYDEAEAGHARVVAALMEGKEP